MITIQTKINLPISKVWEHWTSPTSITQWNFASPEWHCPTSVNDLEDGTFNHRMEAKDGSMGFDFCGTYSKIIPPTEIHYILGDGRKANILFKDINGQTQVEQSFQPESENTLELQETGWQAILNNFKSFCEK